jgi:HlyD family secretion protein
MSMDRRISLRARTLTRLAWAVAVVATGVVGWRCARAAIGGAVVRSTGVTIAEVAYGDLDDVLPTTAEVAPRRTVVLDAREGGYVEEILAEDGDVVAPGQVLARLSNPAVELDVVAREAQITEQLNDLQTTELALEQERLARARERIDVEHHLAEAARGVERAARLHDADVVSRSQLEDAQAQHAYYTRRRAVIDRARTIDDRMRRRQLAQVHDSTALLRANLATTRAHLDHLVVRAPAAGTLTSFELEVGRSVRSGERLGQIDLPGDHKLVARIDQFYAGRVGIGQRAVATVAGARHDLEVAKLYPQVEHGRLVADLVFTGPAPDGLRRGQTLQLRLELGDATRALVLPVGPFLQESGGRWVFVVGADGATARKRAVRLGRRTAHLVEIVDGLAPGDRVVTSSYAGLADHDEIRIE